MNLLPVLNAGNVLSDLRNSVLIYLNRRAM